MRQRPHLDRRKHRMLENVADARGDVGRRQHDECDQHQQHGQMPRPLGRREQFGRDEPRLAIAAKDQIERAEGNEGEGELVLRLAHAVDQAMPECLIGGDQVDEKEDGEAGEKKSHGRQSLVGERDGLDRFPIRANRNAVLGYWFGALSPDQPASTGKDTNAISRVRALGIRAGKQNRRPLLGGGLHHVSADLCQRYLFSSDSSAL